MDDLDSVGTKFRINIENEETGVECHTTVQVFTEEPTDILEGVGRAVSFLIKGMLGIMENKIEEKGEQRQDLSHQKPEETDNLQKSARPDKTYCEDRGIDQDTLGKRD